MYVIAGLGNPGRQYERTRHNMGFLTVDEFAAAHGIDVRRIKHKALIGEGRVAGEKVLLVKPLTFMNKSGEAVSALLRYYKVAPALPSFRACASDCTRTTGNPASA